MSTSAITKRIAGMKQSHAGAISKAVSNLLGKTTYKNVGLNHPYPLATELEPTRYEAARTTITTLPNGIRVASRSTADPIANVGLFINAGSRYCTPDISGTGHFLESLVVEGTNQILPDRFHENLARTGTSMSAQAFRDAMMYQCEVFTKNADFALESLAEVIWNCNIEPWKLSRIHKEYLWRRGDVMKDADHEIPEYMHQAAYQGNTVGLPLFCDHHTIKRMTNDVIDEYLKVFYQPSRMVVVGVGMEHTALEKLALSTFGDLEQDPKYSQVQYGEKAQYTGGQLKFKLDFDSEEPTTHVGLLFETENWHSPDLMALNVLNMIMGGGGSFSAGGPGKGMYTRLYRDVLGNHHWIQHVSCSHSLFEDTGIFSFYGFTSPEHAGDLTGVIVREALDMVERPPNSQELDRAKTSLASNICFECESRHVVFEDLGRQVQVYGSHKSPEMWRDEIMAVTKEDVVRVAKKLLSSKPTLLALGSDVSRVPGVEEVEAAIKNAQ